MDEAVDALYEMQAAKTGIDVKRKQRIISGSSEANGRFLQTVAGMEISENALNEFGDNLHELTHAGAAYNPEKYYGYAGAVMRWYAENRGYGSLIDRMQEIYDVYRANDSKFTKQDALEEFTAEATAGLFSTEDGAEDFVNWLRDESGYTAEQKKTVLQRAAELFERIIARIKELLQDGILSDVAADFAQAQKAEAAKLRQMFLDVLDGMEVQEGATAVQREEKYSIKYPSYTKQQMEDNKKDLAKMEAVHHVPKENLFKTEEKRIDLYKKPFKAWGNNIYSEQFGDVRLPNSSAKSDEHHGRTKEKYATIEAIPDVIQQGKVIFHGVKSNGVSERIVVAAPITIGEEHYYMGVMLNRDNQSQRLYLHDVEKDIAIEKETPLASQAHRLTPGSLDADEHFLITNILQDALNVKHRLKREVNVHISEKDTHSDGKKSLQMAKKVEFTSGQNGEVLKNGLLEIARISTFAAENNREIIRRLQAQSPFFKGLTVAQAAEQLRYAERNGLIERGDGWLTVYHDANDAETDTGDRLRLSLGLEAQNRNLLNRNEEYRKIIQVQDAEIRELQRALTKAGVRTFADGKKVASFASGLLDSYGAKSIRGIERRELNDALEALYNGMANEKQSRDAASLRNSEFRIPNSELKNPAAIATGFSLW